MDPCSPEMSIIRAPIIFAPQHEKDIDIEPTVKSIIADINSEAELISTVSNPAQKATALAVLSRINALCSDIEKARKAVIRPLLTIQQMVNSAVKENIKGIEAHKERISKLLGEYEHEQKMAQLEQQRQRAAAIERIENEYKAKVEELKKRISEAKTPEDAKAAMEMMEQVLQEGKEIIGSDFSIDEPASEKIKGEIVRHTYDFTILNEWALARARPDWVKSIQFSLLSIRDYVNAHGPDLVSGKLTIQGLKVWEETQVSVRRTKDKIVNI